MNPTKRTAILAAIAGAFLVLAFPNDLHAQDPSPPAPVSPGSVPTRQYESPSILEGGEFTSLEGRFSISLPVEKTGFSELNIPTPVGIARGDAYSWRLKEAAFVAGHADAPAALDAPETSQKLFASIHGALKKFADANSGTVRADKPIQLGKYSGVEQRIDLFSGTIIQRTYVVSNRLYQTSIVMKTTQAEFENAAIKVLDTFKILDDSEVAAKEAEAIKKAEPATLPQEPVTQRIGTDATDVHLHGRVKTVLQESQDLSGTWSVQRRKRDRFEEYNKRGNLVRQEFYDNKGNLDEISVYGYIDGKRVSNSNSISHEYNPPPIIVGPSTAAKKAIRGI